MFQIFRRKSSCNTFTWEPPKMILLDFGEIKIHCRVTIPNYPDQSILPYDLCCLVYWRFNFRLYFNYLMDDIMLECLVTSWLKLYFRIDRSRVQYTLFALIVVNILNTVMKYNSFDFLFHCFFLTQFVYFSNVDFFLNTESFH